MNIPTCVGSSKLLQVVLRTRAYGSELSWVVSHRSLLNALVAPTPTEQNIVMAGQQTGLTGEGEAGGIAIPGRKSCGKQPWDEV